jgi:hypothetical protein
MATYVNDLRLTELATGEGSGTWGTTTNQSLELIGEALGYATQQAFGSDADATTTVADGASDPARAMYYKITSAASLTATRTLTIAPNTISRVMFIENATTGSQSIAISQGSGANVTIAAGKTAVVYLDGAGATAAVVDAMAGVDPGVTDTLTEVLVAGNTSGGTNIELSTTDKVQFRDTGIYINSSVDGQLDIVADTEIQIAATTIDVNGTLAFDSLKGTGATTVTNILDEDNMASDSATAIATQQSIKAYVDSQVGSFDTLAEVLAQGNTTGGTDISVTSGDKIVTASNDNLVIEPGGTGNVNIFTDTVAITAAEGESASLVLAADESDDNPDIWRVTSNTGNTLTIGNQISGSIVDHITITPNATVANSLASFAGKLTTAGVITAPSLDISGDIDVDGTANLDVVDIDGAVDMASTLTVGSTLTVAGSLADWSVDSQGVIMNFARNSANYIKAGTTGGYLVFQTNGATAALTLDTSQNATIAGGLTVQGAATFNETGNDADFRVESDSSTHALFVDASTNRVGINASIPEATLDVKTDLAITEAAAANSTSQLNFYSKFSDSQRGFVVLKCESLASGSSDLVINARNAFTDAERLRIASTGEVTFTGNLVIPDWVYHSGDSNTYFGFPSGDEFKVVTANVGRLHIKGSESVWNEGGENVDFRVESDGNANMLFVDASADAVGIGTNSLSRVFNVYHPTTDGAIKLETGGNSSSIWSGIEFKTPNSQGFIYVPSDNTVGLMKFLPASTEVLALTNSAVVVNEPGNDVDFRVESNDNTHMLFVDGGNNRVGIGKAPATHPLEVGVYAQFDTGMTINETGVDADFRVESDNNSYMFYVDGGLDAIGIGTVLGSSYQATQQGMMQFKNGGSEGTPSDGGIEFYAAQANSGYSHRLCAFDNSGGDTPLLLQRRNNSATWSTQVTFEGSNNNVVFAGTVSKGGGSFKIDHPLPSMNGTHHLVHSFVEGPQADNLYRGRVTLVDGQASVNLDTTSNMTEGTFVLLNRDVQCFTSNETGWTAVRGTVSGNTISIEAQDNTCTDTISWMVVGERHDQFMYDNEFADDDGHIIVEPIKKPHLQNT